MSKKTIIGSLVSLIVVLAHVPPSRGQERDAVGWFKTEAPLAWKRYESHTKNMVGHWDAKGTRNGKLETQFHAEIKLNRECRLFVAKTIYHEKSKRRDIFAYGHNQKYFFTLHKKTDSSPWALADLGLDMSRKDAFVEQTMSTLSRGLDVLVTTYSYPLAGLVSRPYFRIVRGRIDRIDDRDFVEIEFESVHDIKKEDKTLWIQRGVLLLDPSNFWCLKKARLDTLSYPDTRGKRVIEYAYGVQGGIPIPEGLVSLSTGVHQGVKHEMESRVDYKIRLVSGGAPDAEFYLSAFGILEPVGVQAPAATRWWLWLGLAAVTAALIGFLFHKLKPRFRTG
jgi:hypothetical protein